MSAGRFPFADRIRAVLFDAGNTLLWLDHARMAGLAAAAGLACDTASLRAAERRARPRLDGWLRGAVRRESPETVARYAALIADEVGGPGAARDAASAALRAAWGTLWNVPAPDAHPVLDDLAARGLLLGCVSNSSGSVRALLDDAGLGARLACVVDSALVGIEKPDPRIFRIASERLGVAPAECVYAGDFLSLDAEGALSAGMKAVLLDPIGAWGDVGVPRAASLTELAARM